LTYCAAARGPLTYPMATGPTILTQPQALQEALTVGHVFIDQAGKVTSVTPVHFAPDGTQQASATDRQTKLTITIAVKNAKYALRVANPHRP
jgi:hypothetical protein